METIEQIALTNALSELTRTDMVERPEEVLFLIRQVTRQLRQAK